MLWTAQSGFDFGAGAGDPISLFVNPLMPNDLYISRTAPLTSKRCILYIYSTNVGTEYFKHALYSLFFFSSKCSLFHNVNFFGACIIHILYTGCAEIKKNNSGAKGLKTSRPDLLPSRACSKSSEVSFPTAKAAGPEEHTPTWI